MGVCISSIDFDRLLDLRLDYLFKLMFGDKQRLISLVNAVFINKKLDRIVTDLAFINTAIEKQSPEDKYSTIDIMATLDSGATTSIEIHLYGLPEFKYKTVRTWAKLYGGGLKEGQKFWKNKPVICISFIDGALKDAEGAPLDQIHSLFQIRERDVRQLLLPDLELHFINMRAFVTKHKTPETKQASYDKFTKWLLLITQSEQSDKEILKKICEEDGEIAVAVELLASMSEDEATRFAYSQRRDMMISYYSALRETEEYRRRIAEYSQQIEESDRRVKESNQRAEEYRQQIEESNRRAAKVMYANNCSITEIAEALSLTEEDVAALI